jgi:hypothetical protein
MHPPRRIDPDDGPVGEKRPSLKKKPARAEKMNYLAASSGVSNHVSQAIRPKGRGIYPERLKKALRDDIRKMMGAA